MADTTTTAQPDTVLVVRYSMTSLLILFTAAVGLSLLVVRRYHLVLFVLWIVVGLLLLGLSWVLRTVTLHKRVFHPTVHRFSDWIHCGFQDFAQDWQEEVLLLTNNCGAAAVPTEAPRRPRTRLFRAIRPLLRVFRRRKQTTKVSNNHHAEAELV